MIRTQIRKKPPAPAAFSLNEVFSLHITAEIAIVFGICLISQVISALLPFAFPASVIGMLLLLVLLMAGIIKERHIQRVSSFLIGNMAFFFLASCVGLMEHASLLMDCLIPFLFIAAVTTPLVYGATAWTIQLMMRFMNRKEGHHD